MTRAKELLQQIALGLVALFLAFTCIAVLGDSKERESDLTTGGDCGIMDAG